MGRLTRAAFVGAGSPRPWNLECGSHAAAWGSLPIRCCALDEKGRKHGLRTPKARRLKEDWKKEALAAIML